MEKTYVFKLVKPWIMVVSTFVLILLLIGVSFPFAKLLNQWTFAALFTVFFFSSLAFGFSCLLNAKMMVKTDCTGFKIIWLKHFIIQKSDDKEYKWDDIESCKSVDDLHLHTYHILKLQMKNGEKTTMYHSVLTLKKDDFGSAANSCV